MPRPTSSYMTGRYQLHLSKSLRPRAAVAADLGSRNGTLLDGVRVSPRARGRPGARRRTHPAALRGRRRAGRAALSGSDRFGAHGRHVAADAPRLRAARARRRRATPRVLLEGETGTGKELAAEAIHERERARATSPFVVVDCGAIPPNLLESELFGHEQRRLHRRRSRARAGAFEAADGRHHLPRRDWRAAARAAAQAAARARARARSSASARTQYAPVDVRVVAATNRDLRAEVNAGSFRADLYYRLAVRRRCALPPLRERLEDIAAARRRRSSRGSARARRGGASLRSADVPRASSRGTLAGQRARAAQLPRALSGPQPPRAPAGRRIRAVCWGRYMTLPRCARAGPRPPSAATSPR